MANNKKTSDSSSLFTKLAVGAPIVGAIGVGTRSLFKNMKSSQFGNASNKNQFLRNYAAKISAGTGTEMFSGNLGIMKDKDPEMIKMAWEMALQQADPAKIIRRDTLNPGNPAETIEFFARTNQSLQGNKVLQSFVRQLGGLQLHSESYAGPAGMFGKGRFSTTMFGRAKKHNFIQSNVAVSTIEDNILRETLTNIQNTIKTIPGAEMNLRKITREGLDGSQLMLHLSGAKFGRGIALEIPMEIKGQPGVIAHGVTLQTKRMVGRYSIIESNRAAHELKHEQMVVRQFAERVLPGLLDDKISSLSVRKSISDFNYNMIKESQWIPNLPRGTIPAHDAAITLGGSRRTLMTNSFERFNAQQAASVLADPLNGFFPSTSGAQLAKGVVSNFNAQKLWLGGEAYPWARRPMQAMGRGFGPSAKSLNARLNNRVRKQFGWLHTSEHQALFGSSPLDVMARTVYIDEDKYPQFAERALGGTLGGTGLYSSTISDQFEHLAPLQTNLSKNAVVNQKLLDLINDKQRFAFETPLKFNEGELLGYDKSRNPVHFTPDMKITGGFSFTDRDAQFIRLEGTRTLPVDKFPKVFGGAKAVLQQTPHIEIEHMIENATGIKVSGAEVALGMDELKKNRALHNLQMFTALNDFGFKQMRSRNGGALKLESFNSEFTKSVQEITARAASGSIYNADEVVKGVHKMASQFALDDFATGRIFGAIPKIYGDSWREDLGKFGVVFSDKQVAQINKRIVTGVGSFYYGGQSNAGGLGSVEPRFFELLQGKQFGSLGPRMSKDIAERMILSNPELVKEQSILGRALKSVTGSTRAAKDESIYNLAKMSHKDIGDVLKKGGIVHTGGILDDVKSIYVPGTDDSIWMREYVTPEGLTTHSELNYAYRDFLETGHKAHIGNMTRRQTQESFNNLIGELGIAHGGTITAKGRGLARSKVPGSRYLQLISGTEEEMGDLYTVGINRKHGLRMFDEMTEVYAHDPNELAALAKQKERFLAGEAIGAIGHRDPLIGPYSSQPLKLKLSHRLKDSDSMLIPQKTRSIFDLEGNKISDVSFSPMTGFAGDFDDDNAHIMLTSSKIEKDVAGHFQVDQWHNKSESAIAYEDYTIRQQLIKAKAPKSVGLTMEAEMVADAQKLAIAKSHVGPLSVPMRELRAAITQNKNTSADSYFNSLSVLEALEQVPISGKHASADKIDEFTSQMTQIAAAGKAGRGEEMSMILKDVLQHNPTAEKLFADNQEVMIDGAKRTIKGIDLAQVAETIATAFSDYRTPQGAISEGIARSIATGKMPLTKQNINPYLQYNGGLLGDFKLGAETFGSDIAETALSMRNKIAAVGGDLIGHLGKPLAIGFGAALGISAILSKPISNLDPSTGPVAPRMNSVNSTNISPENIHPDPEVIGEPSIPATMSGPTARYTNNNSGARINIRGINRSGTNLSSVSSMITQQLRGSTNVNLNVRDRKSSLSQQKIDEITRR